MSAPGAAAARPDPRPRLVAEERDDEDAGRSSLGLSVILHAGIVGAILFQALVFPTEHRVYTPTLRVDVVGLPDSLKKDLKPLPTPEEISEKVAQAKEQAEAVTESAKKTAEAAKKEAAQPVEPEDADDDGAMKLAKPKPEPKSEKGKVDDPKARTQKLKGALDRIRSLERIKGEVEDKPAPRAAPVVKGNQVSKGTSLSGEAREALEATYFDRLRDQLAEKWDLPLWLSRQKLQAQVLLFIDRHGNVRRFQFAKSSGSPQFDDAIKRAIAGAQPLPVPPKDLASEVESKGVLVGFPL